MENEHIRRRAQHAAAIVLIAAAALFASVASSQARSTAPIPSTVPSTAEIFSTIQDLVSQGPRRPGTAAGEFAVSYVADKMRSYGLSDVHVETSTTNAWKATSSSLTYGGTPIDAFPAAFSNDPGGNAAGSFGTSGEGLSAPLVDVGDGAASDYKGKDVKGKIVLFNLRFQLPLAGLLPVMEYLYDPGLTMLNWKTLFTANPYMTNYRTALKNAQDNGAAGFVGVLADYFDSNKYFNEYYSRATNPQPGMWVTKKVGASIRAKLASSPAAKAVLSLQVDRRPAPAHSVMGIVPGQTNDTILITSHHDSVWQGAVEDGSGTAEVLALAKHYASLPTRSRKKTLMFMTDDSHFSGYQAHAAFIRRHVLQRDPLTDPQRLVAVVAIEHIGKAASIDRNGNLVVSDQPEPRGIFENLNSSLGSVVNDAVRENDLRRTAVLSSNLLQAVGGIPTDVCGLMIAGVPTVSLISGPMYMYDEQDTLDKVATDQLRPVANTFRNIVDDLDSANPDRIGYLPLSITEAIGRALLSD
ncbi:MAG: M28 family peptidase [Solirubrobacterales bacterium]